MYKLIIEDDEGKKTIVPLIRDEITIGRKEGNTIRLTERNVSRRHARLSRNNGAVFIEDLESYNGIKVNGSAIEGRVAVAEGDRIQIGDYMLGLRIEGEAERAAAARARPDPAKSEAARKEASLTQQTEPTPAEALPALPVAEDHLAAKTARLVCVSSNFPGLEFTVERPVMVIGRTADNDIAINHRSVSRHHARVIEEQGGRYTIMDMQSANGVRVNGEEYGRIELRRGDLVDLGHVRLRFVAPGEKFDFATDATVYDVSHTEMSRGWIGAAVALAVVAAVAFIVLRTVGSEQEVESPTETSVAAPGSAPVLSVEETAGRVSGIREAVGSRAWEEALALCDQLTGEGRLEVVKECALARAERGAKKAFDEAVAAETRNEHEHALELFGGIPAKSVYYEQAQGSPVYEQAKSKYEAQAAQRIDELVAERACDRAERLATRVRDLLPEAASAEEKIRACREAAVKDPVVARSIEVPRRAKARSRPKAPKSRRSASKRAAARAKAAAAAAPTAQQKAHAQGVLDRAWQAYREGYYARSLQLAEQVLSIVRSQQALSILGASACYLKRARQAQSAFNRLDSQRRQLLRRVCERIGVNLE